MSRTQSTATDLGWSRKFKGDRERGGAWIYTHPDLDAAIVDNHRGVSFRGDAYKSVREAMAAALKENATR